MSEYIYGSIGDPLANALGEIYLPRAEVVRCRNCRWYDTAGPWCFEPSKVFIDEYGLEICPTVTSDGFCAWGERRSE